MSVVIEGLHIRFRLSRAAAERTGKIMCRFRTESGLEFAHVLADDDGVIYIVFEYEMARDVGGPPRDDAPNPVVGQDARRS